MVAQGPHWVACASSALEPRNGTRQPMTGAEVQGLQQVVRSAAGQQAAGQQAAGQQATCQARITGQPRAHPCLPEQGAAGCSAAPPAGRCCCPGTVPPAAHQPAVAMVAMRQWEITVRLRWQENETPRLCTWGSTASSSLARTCMVHGQAQQTLIVQPEGAVYRHQLPQRLATQSARCTEHPP